MTPAPSVNRRPCARGDDREGWKYPFASTGTSVSVAGRVSDAGLLLVPLSESLSGLEQQNTRGRAHFWDYQARVEQKPLDSSRTVELKALREVSLFE